MIPIFASLPPLIPFAVTLLALFVFLEQIKYLRNRRHVPGPSMIIPFVGNAVSLVSNPTQFWDEQSRLAASYGLSANYVVGRFILFIRDSELSHKIFANVRSDAFHLVGHPFGKKLFGEHNMIYMLGQEHKDLRRRIAPNFTPRALSTYTSLQQIIVLKHLQRWIELSSKAAPEPIALRLLARELNLETSQTVFVGPYLSLDARDQFKTDYNLFNVGLMKLPFDLPGFAFRKARFATKRLMDTLAVCVERSKSRMGLGKEPECLIDFWMQDHLREAEAAAAKEADAATTLQQPTEQDIGRHLFDFLFAAQDASTSSLLWAVTLLDSHPDVLSKVREEVAKIWSPESNTLITGDQLREMKYTEAVAREVVRFRAPATLVPHIAGADFPLTDDYTVPKGTIVFPSVYESSFQGFTEPDRFDPDRFSEQRHEDQIYKRNFLAFGAGPHQCVGQRYALNQLVLFIAMFASLVDFKRHRTKDCDDIVFVPTICPKDDCKVFLSRRCKQFPSLSLGSALSAP